MAASKLAQHRGVLADHGRGEILPLVMETYGAFGPKALEAIRWLAELGARENRNLSAKSLELGMLAELGATLQVGNARMLLEAARGRVRV